MVTALNALILSFSMSISPAFLDSSSKKSAGTSWQQALRTKIERIDETHPGKLGIYIEDVGSGEIFSHQAERRYYLASVVKLFVMIEIFQLIEKGQLALSDKIKITTSKYRDGAGRVNWLKAGKRISIKKLLENMMTLSDNAATDILIDVAGLANVENTMLSLGLLDLGPLTSLLDVRKSVFRQVHPLAGSLTALEYMELWKVKSFDQKLIKFASLINKPERRFKRTSLEAAYEHFYGLGNNSVSLTSLGGLLKKLANGEVINRERSQQMIDVMRRCQTGKKRIKAGLPPDWVFANKTGTQFKRVCDAGLAFNKTGSRVVIVACAERFPNRKIGKQQIADASRAFFATWRPAAEKRGSSVAQ